MAIEDRTLSSKVGMPMGLVCDPSPFGIWTRRTIYPPPGHISSEFVIDVLRAVEEVALDVEPPFIVVGGRRDDHVRIRIRGRLYHLVGPVDVLVHVAAPNAEHLRDLALYAFRSRPEVAHLETSLICDSVRGRRLPDFTDHGSPARSRRGRAR